MGNIQALTHKLCKSQSQSQSIFSQQQQQTYTKESAKKCLLRIIDIESMGHSNSLKRIYKYLHPALKYLLYCKQQSPEYQNAGRDFGTGDENGENSLLENFVAIHEEELIVSSGSVLQMYCEYLSHVVPANISYFHFIREKDLYIHYCTLKYVLQAGHSISLSSRSAGIFKRIKAESRRNYIKLISHWLYDMVKYKCSAIYIPSHTLPQLIAVHTAVLCGLISEENANFMDSLKTEAEKILTYQHCMYSFLYVLTEAHVEKHGISEQGNGCLQLAVFGIDRIVQLMWSDIEKSQATRIMSKIQYAPSYWYASHIGFIQHPTLQTISYHLLIDMLLKLNHPAFEFSNLPKESISESRGYVEFLEEKEQGEQIDDHSFYHGTPKSIGTSLMTSKSMEADIIHVQSSGISKYQRINMISQAMMLNCLCHILTHFPTSLCPEPLHMLLCKLCGTTPATSLLRPYILSLASRLKQNPQAPVLDEQLVRYCEENRMDYSTQSSIIPYISVARRFTRFVAARMGELVATYDRQLSRTQEQIWGAIGRIGE